MSNNQQPAPPDGVDMLRKMLGIQPGVMSPTVGVIGPSTFTERQEEYRKRMEYLAKQSMDYNGQEEIAKLLRSVGR